MKKLFVKLLFVLSLSLLFTSCASVRVIADYDKQVNFNEFKTFAFYKPGIDKAEISDLDKRRILKAIESELVAKGYTKSENPDLLVSIIASAREKIDVYNNYYGGAGWGWGWNPYFYGNYNTVSTSTEGVLYIDLIDAKKKELVWQGQGVGYLNFNNVDKKEARIKEFVSQILEKYPPELQ
ncbi:DUF4136 domain-containing protein [Hanstruepera flava]|uniref:DUF4136 domain-containing protein n=1 Tax=Hanstruepera flava TaxID=2930218 RepID=UPI002028D42A|nr:DUF4136 domain-containing protein [Hanstruepera flava]